MRPIIITGRLASGKTVASQFFVSKYNLQPYSMATWLKTAIKDHYHIDKIEKNMEINDKSIRKVMQDLGKYMRIIDINWHVDEVINNLMNNKDHNKFVVDDIRFKNEIERLNEFNPITIKIISDNKKRLERAILRDSRVPTEDEMNDISELEVDEIMVDYEIENNSDIYDLQNKLGEIYEKEKYK